MKLTELKQHGIPDFVIDNLTKKNISKLNPGQEKAIKAGILEGKNALICTPTGSGKTAIATFTLTKILTEKPGSKVVYLVPLKALANDKFREYQELLKDTGLTVIQSTGDIDSGSDWLGKYDLLILTVEKMDSLLRHHCSWLQQVRCVICDEVHLLNDTHRGPTLEILLTLLKDLSNIQIIALSATIGNPEELAEWLNAELVLDTWRPVKLNRGIYHQGEVEFYD
ncbi:MAG: DEAD/DEAH box helicase [Candidatus Woesearchaeota archaeon]|jgi:helicase|nr:DEAD/DEAH box helicase [Candidatus Woesearchaeota archaeon]MDP7610508.1 DEAD/DEAH box helicase [Candidatus Woesearchaeota archaeon]|tara:strand:- start:6665 stop:7339 length:675 start_codon:yes stop_codon:yes gene_type:complete